MYLANYNVSLSRFKIQQVGIGVGSLKLRPKTPYESKKVRPKIPLCIIKITIINMVVIIIIIIIINSNQKFAWRIALQYKVPL